VTTVVTGEDGMTEKGGLNEDL